MRACIVYGIGQASQALFLTEGYRYTGTSYDAIRRRNIFLLSKFLEWVGDVYKVLDRPYLKNIDLGNLFFLVKRV